MAGITSRRKRDRRLSRMTGESETWELTCTTSEGLYLLRDEGAAEEGDPEEVLEGGRELQRRERHR